MEYNTKRNKLLMSEYGRNVQKMINDCAALTDREKRSKTAALIIEVMAQMNPKTREAGDYKQKLWDHLHLISDFKLDVDSPYPKPEAEVLYKKPERLSYPNTRIKYKHYGLNIERIIEKAIAFEEGPEKDALIENIANHMKKSYLNWNRNSVDDTLILHHLEELSDKQLKLREDFKLDHTNEILARNKKAKPDNVKPSTKGSGYSRFGGRPRQKNR